MMSIFKSCKHYFFSFFLILLCLGTAKYASAADGYYYQLKVYHLKTSAQEDRLDSYLKNAYLPALHRMGIKNIGVFKAIAADTSGKRIYVLIPYRNWSQLEKSDKKLMDDQQYLTDGKDYLDAVYTAPVYNRMETIVLGAFPKMPEPAVPELTANKTDRVYELRSYESPTEKYNVNKVQMFNDGNEVALFKRLNFNAVFYANVIAGSHMPNLMYMISFENMEEHDKHWKAFGSDPYWKQLSAKAEYQNNVSHIDAIFLHPAAYSDF